VKEAHLRTVSIPWSNENSGGGGERKEENESSEKIVSAVLRREASMSSLLLLKCREDEEAGSDIHLHGRMVASSIIGKLSWRIFAIRRGRATDPGPMGSLRRKSRMTFDGESDSAD